MNYAEMLAYLDIDSPNEFQYFEMMADLIESEKTIAQEAVFRLFSEADKDIISSLIDSYFEEINGKLSEDFSEVFSLLNQVRLCLKGLIENAEEDSDFRMFTDEFCRFREWYVFNSAVEIIPEGGGMPEFQCLRDAITTLRAEKIGGRKYRYSFDGALDYEIDGYIMSFAELIAAEEDTDE